MVRHSEDWWGVLRQGIELENIGLDRYGAIVLGGARPALVSLGMEIELEHMVSHSHGSAGIGSVRLAGVLLGKVRQVSARCGNRIRKYGKARRVAAWPGNGSDGCGVVSFGKHRRGMEIELENMGRLGSAPARRGTGAVWSGSTWWGFAW